MGRIVLLFLKTLAYLYAWQPRRLQLAWGKLLGNLLYRLKFKASVVEQNLKIAYPDGSSIPEVERYRQKIARESYQNFGCLVLEILLVLGPLKKFVMKYVDLTGVEHLREAEKLGKGMIF